MRGADVADGWTGTRAGMHCSVTLIVKEDDGMPWIDFAPGDMPPVAVARCLQAITEKMVVLESTRLAEELTSNGDVG